VRARQGSADPGELPIQPVLQIVVRYGHHSTTLLIRRRSCQR
jgi:hypothetical protein